MLVRSVEGREGGREDVLVRSVEGREGEKMCW